MAKLTLKTRDELDSLSIEELETYSFELDEYYSGIRDKKREVQEVLETKNVEADAKRRLETIDDRERAALLQELQALGVEPTSDTGTPGE